MGVFSQSVALALGIALPHWVVTSDARRLSPMQRSRGWNVASHWSAVVAFSWICVPVHFAETRRSLGGLALGVLVSALGICVEAALLWGLSTLGA
ncbi:MAG: hypothetical protein RJA70_642 [Pseudomonadota bacterium]|jgi:hypothetical protein